MRGAGAGGDAGFTRAFVEVQGSKPRVPTLILGGDADIPDVHADAGAIEAGIGGSKRVVISDAGHLMYLEKPEEFHRVK
jgi:pimeloyl-ACP methyl ester carboxylesterase